MLTLWRFLAGAIPSMEISREVQHFLEEVSSVGLPCLFLSVKEDIKWQISIMVQRLLWIAAPSQ